MRVLGRKPGKRPFNCHCHAGRIASGGFQLLGSQLACHLPPGGGGHTPRLSAGAAGLGLPPWQGLPTSPCSGFAAKGPSRAGGNLIVCPSDKKHGLMCFLFLRKCRAQGRCLQDRKSGCRGEASGPTPPTRPAGTPHPPASTPALPAGPRRPWPSSRRPRPLSGRGTWPSGAPAPGHRTPGPGLWVASLPPQRPEG